MLFSTKAEYGIRLMVALGQREGDRSRSPLATLAESATLPALLPRAPRREAARSRASSPRSAAPTAATGSPGRPSEIQMLEVVEALEGPIAPMECFRPDNDGKVLCSHESDGDHRLLDQAALDAGSRQHHPRPGGDDARRAGRVRAQPRRIHHGRRRERSLSPSLP